MPRGYGFNGGARLGQFATLGLSAFAADTGGKLAVKGAAKAIGTPAKSLFQAMDNIPAVRSRVEKAVKERPELFTQAIQAGAGVDDIMLHHQMRAFGDAIQADGAGLESVSAKSGQLSRPISNRGSYRGGGLSSGPFRPMVRSGTLEAIGSAVSSVKSTVSNSNLGLIGKSIVSDYKQAGGLSGAVAAKVIPAAGTAANKVSGRFTRFATEPVEQAAGKYVANQQLKQERMAGMRRHMRDVLATNSLAARIPHINHLYDGQQNVFTGFSVAEQSYHDAHTSLVSALQSTTSMSPKQANKTISEMENRWNSGQHVQNLSSYSPAVQTAYRQAYSSYRPAMLDRQAKNAVLSSRLQLTPPADPHRNNKLGTQALMQDARNAVRYGR